MPSPCASAVSLYLPFCRLETSCTVVKGESDAGKSTHMLAPISLPFGGRQRSYVHFSLVKLLEAPGPVDGVPVSLVLIFGVIFPGSIGINSTAWPWRDHRWSHCVPIMSSLRGSSRARGAAGRDSAESQVIATYTVSAITPATIGSLRCVVPSVSSCSASLPSAAGRRLSYLR